MKTLLQAALLAGVILFPGCGGARQARHAAVAHEPGWRGPEVWHSHIAAFSKADSAETRQAGEVLFVGSSSIRMWDLKKYFPGLAAVNRGFGGSYISDSAHYADKLISSARPRLIVFYSGDNDIADGKPPERLKADFEDFLEAAGKKAQQVPVIYISIKPSLARWARWPEIQEANRLIKASCGRRETCRFLDVAPAMLGPDGLPRRELFQADGLHLTDQGYRLWSGLLAPLLASD